MYAEPTFSDAAYIDMDKYLQDIVRDKRYWESKRQNIRQREKKLEELTARYEADLIALEKQRKELLKQAKGDAAQLLAEANARIENTILEIKEAQAEKEKTRIARQKFEQFKTELEETPTVDDKISKKLKQINDRKKRKQQKREESILQPTAHTVLMKGDSVRLKGQNSVGRDDSIGMLLVESVQ